MFDKLKFVFVGLYASGVTVGTFIFLFRVVFEPIPKENMQNANTILGFLLGTALGTVLTYIFGASMSQSAAAKKDKPPEPDKHAL